MPKLKNEGFTVFAVSAVLKPRLSKPVMTVASKSFSAMMLALSAQFHSPKILLSKGVVFRPSDGTSWVNVIADRDRD